MRVIAVGLGFIAVLCGLRAGRTAQAAEAGCELGKLTPAAEENQSLFGVVVTMSDDRVVVGVRGDDQAALNAGAASVFQRSGISWIAEAKLTASDAATGDAFGDGVAISGDYVVVGAQQNDDAGSESGSAYVFHWSGTTWTEQAKLTASDAQPDARFGRSVAVDGDYAVVGATENLLELAPGSAYVFRRDGATWTEEAKLTASDAGPDDRFGGSVAICGDYLVVGARSHDGAAVDAGAAYVFRRDETNWVEETKLTAGDAAPADAFGNAVSCSGGAVAIGARSDDDLGENSGSVYVFRQSGTAWSQEAKLTASDGAESDQFGWSVALNDDEIVAGAPYHSVAGIASGAAYVFVRNGAIWEEAGQAVPAVAGSHDSFGNAVAIRQDRVAVAAPGDDDVGNNSGSVTVFGAYSSPAPDCNTNGWADVCDLAGGTSIDADSNGIPDECPILGDADGDGDADLSDFVVLVDCVSGPEGAPNPTPPTTPEHCLAVFDWNQDGDVDLGDLAGFQWTYTDP